MFSRYCIKKVNVDKIRVANIADIRGHFSGNFNLCLSLTRTARERCSLLLILCQFFFILKVFLLFLLALSPRPLSRSSPDLPGRCKMGYRTYRKKLFPFDRLTSLSNAKNRENLSRDDRYPLVHLVHFT